MDDAERSQLLARNAELDRPRRRWKVLALAAIALLALASAVMLKEAVERGRQAREAAEEEASFRALVVAELVRQNAAQDGQGRPLSLALEPIERDVRAGTTPRFRLTVTNTSKEPEKVLDIRGRVDLQHTYYDLKITRNGMPVGLPRGFSCPGPMADHDFLSLAPGTSVTFVLDRFPEPFNELRPGIYRASVRFWHPLGGHEASYNSPEATFRVRE